MQDTFTEEQSQFRDVVARFCRDESPTSRVREVAESEPGFDPALWKTLCQQLGIVAIHLPEERGGGGFGPVELGIVMEELGRHLLPAPYFSSAVLSCTALAAIDDAKLRDEWMGPLLVGERISTLALDPAHGWPVVDLDLAGGKLRGTLRGVLDAAAADTLLLLVRDGRNGALCSVEMADAGVSVRARRTMDGTRRLGDVHLDSVSVRVLAELDLSAITTIYDTALVALANEMVGGAQELLRDTLEYVQVRFQFGRPIGSFQALKHRLADLHVDVELAKVAAWQAAAALASDEDASADASLAKFTTADVYVTAALEAIQLHGGIGFTWENDTHLWYRRAKSSEVFLGTPAFHRDRMLKEITG
jgi:alkylation response protein AidB-like acyl-CoA dehydrogenase